MPQHRVPRSPTDEHPCASRPAASPPAPEHVPSKKKHPHEHVAALCPLATTPSGQFWPPPHTSPRLFPRSSPPATALDPCLRLHAPPDRRAHAPGARAALSTRRPGRRAHSPPRHRRRTSTLQMYWRRQAAAAGSDAHFSGSPGSRQHAAKTQDDGLGASSPAPRRLTSMARYLQIQLKHTNELMLPHPTLVQSTLWLVSSYSSDALLLRSGKGTGSAHTVVCCWDQHAPVVNLWLLSRMDA
ncbi:uncharacterized protein [Triticum aestivum]|uniref:uncharacterized protein n=1 Tax=Triticum aestivum TaxID=4565 RepID=UPI001D00B1E3|nr:uncharacterized protein LOC123172982 [Triticum aestivum]